MDQWLLMSKARSGQLGLDQGIRAWQGWMGRGQPLQELVGKKKIQMVLVPWRWAEDQRRCPKSEANSTTATLHEHPLCTWHHTRAFTLILMQSSYKALGVGILVPPSLIDNTMKGTETQRCDQLHPASLWQLGFEPMAV